MCDSKVDPHAFSIMGRVRTDPVHVHFPGNLQQMHIWFSRSVTSDPINIKLNSQTSHYDYMETQILTIGFILI